MRPGKSSPHFYRPIPVSAISSRVSVCSTRRALVISSSSSRYSGGMPLDMYEEAARLDAVDKDDAVEVYEGAGDCGQCDVWPKGSKELWELLKDCTKLEGLLF